jgi:lipoprotein-releasing system ATP-binding protein
MDDSQTEIMRLESISRSYHAKMSTIDLLEETSLSIKNAETIGIVGSSGIGKSTLLNIIGTLDKPDKGAVFFRETDLANYNDNELALFRNQKIGFVFQFHYLLQGFTSLENVMMPGLIGFKKKKSVEIEALNMLDRVGLSHRSEHRVEDLSGGEQQRVALARALVNKPDILLADEPTGNLDTANSEEVHRLINELNRDLGMTVIIVTHNNDLAQLMDRRVTISEHKIVPVD